jgi:hypothetical protein
VAFKKQEKKRKRKRGLIYLEEKTKEAFYLK